MIAHSPTSFTSLSALSVRRVRPSVRPATQVSITDPERNYHVFYQLCDGASEEEVAAWRLRPAREFSYLNQSTCFELEGVSDSEEYHATRKAMSVVGITDEEQGQIFQASDSTRR